MKKYWKCIASTKGYLLQHVLFFLTVLKSKSACMRYPSGGLKAGDAPNPPAITLAPKFWAAASKCFCLPCTTVYYSIPIYTTPRHCLLHCTSCLLHYEACSQQGHRSTSRPATEHQATRSPSDDCTGAAGGAGMGRGAEGLLSGCGEGYIPSKGPVPGPNGALGASLFRSKFRLFLDIDVWSIWGRFGVPSWGHVRLFGQPSWTKFGPKRVLKAYLDQTRENPQHRFR